ncbi:MAG: hypothetical protein ACK48H_20660 [Microcystis sp.]
MLFYYSSQNRVSYQLSVISYQLSVISYQLSVMALRYLLWFDRGA